MFILTEFSDLVQIPPHEFYKQSRDAIEDKINEKYSNKVVHKVGLCICMYDLLEASDGMIGQGTGNSNINVKFRMIVFRPFRREIITATITRCIPSGIQLSTRFFDDIFVPGPMLFEGCEYDESEKIWVWKTEGSEVYFDPSTVVNARVENEIWQYGMGVETADEGPRPIPYRIEASMCESGLGGLDWW